MHWFVMLARVFRPQGREEVGGGRWKVGWTHIDEDGTCSLSSRQLRALDVSDAEEEESSHIASIVAER